MRANQTEEREVKVSNKGFRLTAKQTDKQTIKQEIGQTKR